MHRVSGHDGQLFLVSDHAPFRVWLETENGWDWRVSDQSLSFWGEVTTEVLDGDRDWVEVIPDEVRAYSGSLTLGRCTENPVRVYGSCYPLSLAVSGEWELSIETLVGQQTLGDTSPPVRSGDVRAVLTSCVVDEGVRSFLGSERVLARLKSAQGMFWGMGRVSDNGDRFVVQFEEGVKSGRC